jgi:hypothetical protein
MSAGRWMERNNSGFAGIRRLIAHRKLWFQHAGLAITAAQHESTRRNVTEWSRQQESRYLDHADGLRANMVLFDLLSILQGGWVLLHVAGYAALPGVMRLSVARRGGATVTVGCQLGSQSGYRYPDSRAIGPVFAWSYG